MTRSIWKPIFQNISVLKSGKKKNEIKIWSRSSLITENFKNKKVLVHKGLHNLMYLFIKKQMIGYKFGEFVFTKKMGSNIHRKKKK